jgi:hypothetical protein
LRLRRVLPSQHVGIERRERLDVGRRRGTKHEAIAEIARKLGHGPDECSAVVNPPPIALASGLQPVAPGRHVADETTTDETEGLTR